MTEEKKEEAKGITREELVAALKNPQLAASMAEQAKNMGLLGNETKNVPVSIEAPKDLEIPEGADAKTVASLVSAHSKKWAQYAEDKTTRDKLSVKKETEANKVKNAQQKVAAFFEDEKHIKYANDEKFLREMSIHHNAGESLEKSFKKTLKVLEIKEETKDVKKEESTTEQSNITNISSLESGNVDIEAKAKQLTKKDAAKSAWDKVVSENPDNKKILLGEM